MTKPEENDDYRPYDTLKALGFSKDDAKGFLANIATAGETQLPPEPEKTPDIEVKFREQKAVQKQARVRRLRLIGCVYAVAICLYAILLQVTHPDWIYASVAPWLPIGLDYLAATVLVASFIIITTISMQTTKLNVHSRAEHSQNSQSRTQ